MFYTYEPVINTSFALELVLSTIRRFSTKLNTHKREIRHATFLPSAIRIATALAHKVIRIIDTIILELDFAAAMPNDSVRGDE
ncbi:hypothetical protein D915_007529 [Fasciola hepatica]|uniref:Uncharacterized protein n=1 Tax=Fasciola hepatica TaxID=6192 RepID=A0A4E0RYN0_FASHE|nr:hypothetical protein D915_007529 [Fasciola hepatica]